MLINYVSIFLRDLFSNSHPRFGHYRFSLFRGDKGNNSFYSAKIFKLNFKVFFGPAPSFLSHNSNLKTFTITPSIFRMNFAVKAAAKVIAYFYLPKLFETFFEFIF
jgi:hypothetical protein